MWIVFESTTQLRFLGHRTDKQMGLFDWISGRVFNIVHRNNLVYNTCWEDPRLDREAMKLTSDDNVLVITSAGCNALDYALCEPNHIYAVDMNFRQNALLELKQAAIRKLDFEDFFAMFGKGRLPGYWKIYQDLLRSELCEASQKFWDRRPRFFDHQRLSFYFRSTSGSFARVLKIYTDKVLGIRPVIERLINADSIEEQQEIYTKELEKKFWTRTMKFFMNRDTTLSMIGVPKAQRKQIETQYEGGVVKYVRDCVEAVFTKLPLKDNYFWRVYVNGEYSKECCPEYLKAENFERLKNGLVDNISTHTESVEGFLKQHEGKISRFVLLDHMDWLSDKFFPLLESEWQSIIDTAAPNARVLWRSGGLKTDFVEEVKVTHNGKSVMLPELLTYHQDLAEELHKLDRVHTYASFYIADLAV